MAEKDQNQNTRLLRIAKQIGQAKQKVKIQLDKIEKSGAENKDIDISVARLDGKATWQDNLILAVYVPNIFKKKKDKSNQQSDSANADLPDGDFTINASAYTAAADECGKSDGITASGKKVSQGRTLACPPGYKFGTQIEIDGMGTYTCEDRGGAIKGNHFDVYMETKAQAFAFGRRNLVARVVK
ncbi:MAG: 3D domain-containing protein [Patescibacteria group bacterium]|nr:3D domain-containing protein [Patescibacteria group bacterium]